MQSHRKRFGERKLAQRDVPRHGIALPLAHHEVFLEHALHVRKQARAAEEFHLGAEVLAALTAIVTATTGMRRRNGDVVARFHASDAGTDRGDDAGGFVAWDQRLAHDEAAVAAFEIVVEIRTANAGGAQLQQHFARTRRGGLGRLDPQVFLGVNSAS